REREREREMWSREKGRTKERTGPLGEVQPSVTPLQLILMPCGYTAHTHTLSLTHTHTDTHTLHSSSHIHTHAHTHTRLRLARCCVCAEGREDFWNPCWSHTLTRGTFRILPNTILCICVWPRSAGVLSPNARPETKF